MSTKERITEAAARLFAEKGYLGMTIKEIANDVGIKPPSVYAFFEGKDDIFLTIYRETLEDHLLTVKSQMKTNESAKSQLFAILKSVIDFQFEENLKTRILIRFLVSPPDFLKDDIAKRFGVMEDNEHGILYKIFEHGIANGEIREADCNDLAIAFQCLMDGLFWQMQRHNEEEIYKRVDIIFNNFWDGISR